MKIYLFLNAIFLAFTFSIQNTIASKDDFAYVTHIKGRVTILPPGAKFAHELKVGDQVHEDSSVLTYDKSFVRIKFADDSHLTVSPNSKTIIRRYRKKKTKLINLIKGKVRTYIKPIKNNKKVKAVVQTPNLILGVRGTEFISSYNELNKTSSILTLEGRVDVARYAEAGPLKQVKEKELFKKGKTRVVTMGEFSKNNNIQKLGRPVRISLNQYSKIKVNRPFIKKGNEELNQEIDQARSDYSSYRSENSNKKSRLGLPGGYVDLESGIYIAPSAKSSKFNKETMVFEDSRPLGNISEEGSYLPPKGIHLDPNKGLVVVEKDKLSEEVLMQVKEKNEFIKRSSAPIENTLNEAYEKYFE